MKVTNHAMDKFAILTGCKKSRSYMYDRILEMIECAHYVTPKTVVSKIIDHGFNQNIKYKFYYGYVFVIDNDNVVTMYQSKKAKLKSK